MKKTLPLLSKSRTTWFFLLLVALPLAAADDVCRGPAEECCRKADGEVDQGCLSELAYQLQDQRIKQAGTQADADALAELWLQQMIFIAQTKRFDELRPAIDMALLHSSSEEGDLMWEYNLLLAFDELRKAKAFEDGVYLLSRLRPRVEPWLDSPDEEPRDKARRLVLGIENSLTMAYLQLGLSELPRRALKRMIEKGRKWNYPEPVRLGKMLQGFLSAQEKGDALEILQEAQRTLGSMSPELGERLEAVAKLAKAIQEADKSSPPPDDILDILEPADQEGRVSREIASIFNRVDDLSKSGDLDTAMDALFSLFNDRLDDVPFSQAFEYRVETAYRILTGTNLRKRRSRLLWKALRSLESGAAHLGTLPGQQAGVRQIDPELFSKAIDMLGGSTDLEAFDFAERARHWTRRWQLGSPRLAQAPSGGEEEAALQAQLAELENRFLMESDRGKSVQLLERLEEMRREFELARRQRQLLEPIQPVNDRPYTRASELKKLLPSSETAVVSYFVGFRSLWMWVITSEGIDEISVPMKEEDWALLACGVENLRYAPAQGFPTLRRCRSGNRPLPQRLFDFLISPMQKHLEGRNRLVFVPDGVLHLLSFAALKNPDSGRFLVQDFEISRATTVKSWLSSQEKSSSEDPPRLALVLGDPEIGPPLKGARIEAQQVAEALGTQARVGPQAAEAVVRSVAADISVLHIAAHGELDSKHPIFSRLRLAHGAGEDGSLFLFEVWDGLKLEKTRLVVLSACETGTTRPGEAFGLTEAFLNAGSRAVISTFWSVEDKATRLLMDRFYSHWTKGAEAATALRSAQLELLAMEEQAAPYSWAGFTLTGDPTVRW